MPEEISKLDTVRHVLSPRESELAGFVAAGYSNREIAAMLGIRQQTVKNHVSAVFRKLGVDNRVRLTLALAKTGGEGSIVINLNLVSDSIPNGSPGPQMVVGRSSVQGSIAQRS